MEPYFVTTPIYYINAEPHLGHTYTTVVADTVTRFRRARGDTAFFLTGTDEHGDKIATAAEEAGVEPKVYADRISRIFRETWDECGFHYDYFVRTTDENHVHTVRDFLSRVHEAGDIYHSSYAGLYCAGCERFLTEKELVDDKCPDHQVAPERIEEENYFFRMTKYLDSLLEMLEKNPELVTPERYRNEVVSLLRSGELGDLCISRPKSRLTWGIELPFDSDYVTYVWFDALINYISSLDVQGEGGREKFWPQAHHVIGKDILKPHAIYWPTMLMALGLPMYKELRVHGYWVRGEAKMSKSLGNVIRPLDMKERYGDRFLTLFSLARDGLRPGCNIFRRRFHY